MGLIRRKKSGNIFGGSKLNVPGQGIYNVKISESDKIPVNGINPNPKRRPTPTPTKPPLPTPTPTPSITPTPTPTPSSSAICLLAQENFDNILTENGDFIIVECP